MHPKTALKRGFAIVEDEGGKLVTSAGTVNVSDSLKITLKDGTVQAVVHKRG